MLRLMTEMMKLPITLFVSGMEVFVRAMREYQHIVGRALETTAENIGSDAARLPGRGGRPQNARVTALSAPAT
jgi:hypothetical protein